ncbi:MAG: right-handed parallel beta-helix repeat-containing protein [Prosthecobacter sp.]|nr:right-handed parallel beta-helix repeat-containing protein [Prosthecobacter sp.]
MHRSLLGLAIILTCSLHAQEIRRVPLVLTQGGTPEQPAVFDGKGMIIDLGIDITDREWLKNGDVWTSRGPLPDHPPVPDTQRAGLFIDEVPVRIMRDRAAEQQSGLAGKIIYTVPAALKPGEMGWAGDGSLYFRWPAEKPPGSARIIQPPAKLASCVAIACSHIIVKNIVAKHAANDGFNIHGHRVGVRLENVKAFSNGDEGISAHETVQMDVLDSEIAWNGSSAGGVADVGDSVTTYTNCELHHNVNAAFFFDGKTHRVTNCVIHHQDKDIVVRGDAVVEQSGVEWRRE